MPRDKIDLLLIRHGETAANISGALDTAIPGPPLTKLGNRQAASIPGALDGEPVSAIFASVMVRTQETAKPLSSDRGIEVQVLAGSHEISAGTLEGRSDKQAQREYLDTLGAWSRGETDRRLAGGESGVEFLDRFASAVEQATTGAGLGTVVIVSHGAAIRAATAAFAGLDAAHADRLSLHNTGYARLCMQSATVWTLVNWHAEPIGGDELVDPQADDPTGTRRTDS